jgi:hypothetical protein
MIWLWEAWVGDNMHPTSVFALGLRDKALWIDSCDYPAVPLLFMKAAVHPGPLLNT